MWLNLETLEWHEPCMTQITTDSEGKVKWTFYLALILWDTFPILHRFVRCYLLDYGAGWRLAGGGGGVGLWGYWTVGADRDWQGLVALAGLNRPMGMTITKIARKVAQTTLLLCVPGEIALSLVLKLLICAFNPSQNAPLKLWWGDQTNFIREC